MLGAVDHKPIGPSRATEIVQQYPKGVYDDKCYGLGSRWRSMGSACWPKTCCIRVTEDIRDLRTILIRLRAVVDRLAHAT